MDSTIHVLSYIIVIIAGLLVVLKARQSYIRALSGKGHPTTRIWFLFFNIWDGDARSESFAWLRVRRHIETHLRNDADYELLIEAVNKQIKLVRRLMVA